MTGQSRVNDAILLLQTPTEDAARAALEQLKNLNSEAPDLGQVPYNMGLAYMRLVAAALSLGLGVIFADQLSLPVVRLREAARRMAQGELGATVPATGRDEVAELTVAFNEMSLRLRRDADEIARKNNEIEGFNRDLQRRSAQALSYASAIAQTTADFR